MCAVDRSPQGAHTVTAGLELRLGLICPWSPSQNGLLGDGELQTVGPDFGTGSLRVDPRKTPLLLVTLCAPGRHELNTFFVHMPSSPGSSHLRPKLREQRTTVGTSVGSKMNPASFVPQVLVRAMKFCQTWASLGSSLSSQFTLPSVGFWKSEACSPPSALLRVTSEPGGGF